MGASLDDVDQLSSDTSVAGADDEDPDPDHVGQKRFQSTVKPLILDPNTARNFVVHS